MTAANYIIVKFDIFISLAVDQDLVTRTVPHPGIRLGPIYMRSFSGFVH